MEHSGTPNSGKDTYYWQIQLCNNQIWTGQIKIIVKTQGEGPDMLSCIPQLGATTLQMSSCIYGRWVF